MQTPLAKCSVGLKCDILAGDRKTQLKLNRYSTVSSIIFIVHANLKQMHETFIFLFMYNTWSWLI